MDSIYVAVLRRKDGPDANGNHHRRMTAAAMHKRNAKGESQPTDAVTAAVP